MLSFPYQISQSLLFLLTAKDSIYRTVRKLTYLPLVQGEMLSDECVLITEAAAKYSNIIRLLCISIRAFQISKWTNVRSTQSDNPSPSTTQNDDPHKSQ